MVYIWIIEIAITQVGTEKSGKTDPSWKTQ